MSETQASPRATRTKTADTAAPAISDDLISRIIEVTERRAASRPNPMTLDSFEQIEAFAERASRSAMVPKDYQGKPDNIIIAVMKGKELGMPPIQALESIAIVNGRSSLWGAMVEGLCYASGLVEDHEEHFEGTEGTDDFTAVCTVKRRGIASPKVGRFSQRDARVAGLYGKAVHGAYPRRMMQWRAKHPAFNDAFPDVLKGIAVRELEAEDALAAPSWTLPQPERNWFNIKPQTQSDGWDDNWFQGVNQKLINETNAWKWLDLLAACLTDAPTLRDVNEIGDLPGVIKSTEAAPEDAKQAIETAFATARARFAEKAKETTTPAAATRMPASAPATAEATGGEPQTPPPVADPIPATTAASGAVPFTAWLMDADGTEAADEDGVIPTEPFTDPVVFARAFVEARGNLFPLDVEAFEAANKAGIAAAMIASTEVAPLLISEPPPAEPTLPMSMPIDPAFIALDSPGKLTKPAMTEFNKQLEARYEQATTIDGIDHINAVNEPIYSTFPGSFRLASLALYDNRRRELTPAPTGQMAETMEQLALDMVNDIHSLTTGQSCDIWEASTAVKARMLDLATNDPVRHTQVVAALRHTQLMFAVKACTTKKQATDLSKDVNLIERMRWLREHAPLVRNNTAAEMDRHVAALPE